MPGMLWPCQRCGRALCSFCMLPLQVSLATESVLETMDYEELSTDQVRQCILVARCMNNYTSFFEQMGEI